MIATKVLPSQFWDWNNKWGAPFGRRQRGFGSRLRRTLLGRRDLPIWMEARWRGPFGWQPNNSIRVFEYPWAYHVIHHRGRGLRVLEVGGGLSGLQFVLAAEDTVSSMLNQDRTAWDGTIVLNSILDCVRRSTHQ